MWRLWILGIVLSAVIFPHTVQANFFDTHSRSVLHDESGNVPHFVEAILERHFGRDWVNNFATIGVLSTNRFLDEELRLYYADRDHPRRTQRKLAIEYIRRRFVEVLGLPLGLSQMEKEVFEANPDHPLFASVAIQDFPSEVLQAITSQSDPFFSFDLVSMTFLDLIKIYYCEEVVSKGYVILAGPPRRAVRQALTDVLGAHFLRRYAAEFVPSKPLQASDFERPIEKLMRAYKVVTIEDFLMMMESGEFLALQNSDPSAVQDAILRLRSLGFGFIVPRRLLEEPRTSMVPDSSLEPAVEGFGGLAVRIRPAVRERPVRLLDWSRIISRMRTALLDPKAKEFEGMSSRLATVLTASGSTTRAQLHAAPEHQLAKMPGMTERLFREIREIRGGAPLPLAAPSTPSSTPSNRSCEELFSQRKTAS